MTFSYPDALALEVASVIAEGTPNWSEARSKVAESKGLAPNVKMPDDKAVESALRAHYAVFEPDEHAKRLRDLRKTALIVMEELEPYNPLLVKGVLNGCADQYSDIYLKLECEDPKTLEFELFDLCGDIEVDSYPNPGKRDPVERISFIGPAPEGTFLKEKNISVWVHTDIYEKYPAFKTKGQKEPDPWQIKEECAECATTGELKALIEKSRA